MLGFPSQFALRRLSNDAREDLTWWCTTLHLYNGIHLFSITRPLLALYTDASDNGLGFFYFPTSSAQDAGNWRAAAPTLSSLQAAMIPADHSVHINVKEVAAILQAFLYHAALWAHTRVLIYTDSSTAFHGLSSSSLRGPAHKPLLALLTEAARFDIDLEPHWLPSAENSLADALSRSDLGTLADLCPHWQNYSSLTRLPLSPPALSLMPDTPN